MTDEPEIKMTKIACHVPVSREWMERNYRRMEREQAEKSDRALRAIGLAMMLSAMVCLVLAWVVILWTRGAF